MAEKTLKTLGIIPVRYESTRLPGKALIDILGKPMISWVYERAKQSALLDGLVVATDSEKIERFCQEEKIPVVMTGTHQSGSDRLYEVVQKRDADVYVNIQGDEPTVQPSHLDSLLSAFNSDEVRVATLKVRLDPADAENPNTVKVVTSNSDWALYFSRSPLPYRRNQESRLPFFKHIGIYAYRREALVDFHETERSSLEKTEQLEQLRFLENGIPIYVVETDFDTIGVDTEEDLQRAEEFLTQEQEKGTGGKG